MSRLIRLVDESDPSEDVMVLGGAHGVVTMHLPGGHPDVMVLHSPVEVYGWTGPRPCQWMETACWCLSSVRGSRLRAVMPPGWEELGEKDLWAVMEHSYRLCLERRAR